MRRVLLATVAAALLLAGAAFGKSPRYPAWLETSERQTLARVFGGATHRLTGAFRFCEVVGDRPPLSACLAR